MPLMNLRFDCAAGNQCAISIRQAQLNRAVQAQVEELVKLNQPKMTFSAQFLTNCGSMVNIKCYFMLTVALVR